METSSNILSQVIIYMKYARFIPGLNRRETWNEIIDRNKLMHIKKFPKLKQDIEEAYKFVYDKKILPSMRSLQFAGKAIETNPARLYNCSAVAIDDPFVFAEIMFLLLSGCGVGWSVQKHHIDKLPLIQKPIKRKRRHLVQDSIEGWADVVKVLMKAYFYGLSDPDFDYSLIRPKGAPLLTSGGVAPGPEPLKICEQQIRKILNYKDPGTKLTPLECHDLLCHMSDAVLSGGIRRSSAISLFSLSDEEMLHCKYGDWESQNPQRARANNSAMLLRYRIKRKDFDELWDKIKNSNSGEPGLFFSNCSEYLANPCGEISLRASGGFCNLVEVNVSNIESEEDLMQRIKYATFIATLQSSYTDFHYLRDVWKENAEKDSLIGVGMTGIASGAILECNLVAAAELVKEENSRVAELLGINKAARTTTVKPSGTSSLVLGCSSGIHAWHSQYYLRRVRVLKDEALYVYLKKNIPDLVEDDFFNPNQAVVTFPIKAPNGSIFRDESPIDLLERVKKFYDEWIVTGHEKGDNTNNISCTVSIKDDEWKEVGDWMWKNRSHYNGISVMPFDGGSYRQAPLEECSRYIYDKYMEYVKDIDLSRVLEEEDKTDLKENVACSGNSCEVF